MQLSNLIPVLSTGYDPGTGSRLTPDAVTALISDMPRSGQLEEEEGAPFGLLPSLCLA